MVITRFGHYVKLTQSLSSSDGSLICTAAQGSDSSRDESISDVASDTFAVFYERAPHTTGGFLGFLFFFPAKLLRRNHMRDACDAARNSLTEKFLALIGLS